MKDAFISQQILQEIGPRFFVASCLLLLLLFPNLSNASTDVSATYTKSQGTELVISIHIGTPAPSTLIIVQKLPPGIRVVHAQPTAKNSNPAKGEVKWLIREVTPGTRTIRMSLDRAVSAEEISGQIRYKPPTGGGIQTRPVQKP